MLTFKEREQKKSQAVCETLEARLQQVISPTEGRRTDEMRLKRRKFTI